jgi:hypothetical protein
MTKDRLTLAVAAAVTVLWIAAGLVALLAARAEAVLLTITGPFGVVLGYWFGDTWLRKPRGDEDEYRRPRR